MYLIGEFIFQFNKNLLKSDSFALPLIVEVFPHHFISQQNFINVVIKIEYYIRKAKEIESKLL